MMTESLDFYNDSPCGYFSSLPNSLIIKINCTLLDWLGYQENELVEKIHWQKLLSIGWKMYYETHYTPLLQMHGRVSEINFEMVSKNGSRLPVLINTKQVLDQEGKPMVNHSTVFDITQRKQYEKELLSAKKIAEEKNEKLLQAEEETRILSETLQAQNEDLQNSLAQVIHLRQESELSRKQSDSLLKKVTPSINYAKRIQKAIIPKESELQKQLDCFVFFRPKDIVSGDFYWFATKENIKILAVADCTGHGVSGAMLTMIGNNILNQIVHDMEIHSPEKMLNLMPILLEKTLSYADGKLKDGMDISIITLQKFETFVKLEYAGAMNSLYYVKNHEFREIKADKMPISKEIREDFLYQKHELIIEHPVTFYLCSDGFQDQFGGAENRKFMVGKFKKLLYDISEKQIDEQKQILEQTFETWKENQKQTDDVLVVGLRV